MNINVIAALNVVETEIRGQPKEIGVGLDHLGGEILRRTGDQLSVSFTNDEWLALHNCYLTHNHPPDQGSVQTEEFTLSVARTPCGTPSSSRTSRRILSRSVRNSAERETSTP